MFKYVASFFLFFCLYLPLTATAIEIGDTIPSFSGTDMDGNPVDLGAMIGEQPVMLIFWASWCPNCKNEVPKVNALYKKYGSLGMAFVWINVGYNDSIKRARAFMESTKMTHPVLFDDTGAISNQFEILGVPTIIVADKKGEVVFKNFAVPEMNDETFKQLTQ